MTLEELRKRLSDVDRELIGLVAARQRIVAEIGALKIRNAVPTRDYEREREVLKSAEEHARALGLEAGVAAEVMALLIRFSLAHQEQTRVAAQTSSAGKRALIIGGAGKMGAWFAQFLASQGFAVEIADPSEVPSPFPRVADWSSDSLDQDLIIVATPMKTAGGILLALAERKPGGLIVDIGSLKSPLRAGLRQLVAAGCKVTSIHPLFGPDTRLLSGRHVVFCNVGDPEATRERGTVDDGRPLEMSIDGGRSWPCARPVARPELAFFGAAQRRLAQLLEMSSDLRRAAQDSRPRRDRQSASVFRDSGARLRRASVTALRAAADAFSNCADGANRAVDLGSLVAAIGRERERRRTPVGHKPAGVFWSGSADVKNQDEWTYRRWVSARTSDTSSSAASLRGPSWRGGGNFSRRDRPESG
jgi:chorismate mutase/prephenate dehydrogenase